MASNSRAPTRYDDIDEPSYRVRGGGGDRSRRDDHRDRERDRDRDYGRRDQQYSSRDDSCRRSTSSRDYNDGSARNDRDYRRRSRSPRRDDYRGDRRGDHRDSDRSYNRDSRDNRRDKDDDRNGYRPRSRSPPGAVPHRSDRAVSHTSSSSHHRERERDRDGGAVRADEHRIPAPRDHDRHGQRDRDRSRNVSTPPPAAPIKSADDAADIDQDEMARLMGFSGFDTTSQKHVQDDLSAAAVKRERTHRQYMNRKGGFNRPLDKIK